MGLKEKTVLFFVFALAIVANVATLKDGHNWGDDFSQYIIHANNIIEGKPYASGIMLDNPVVCPPGFPLLLIPVLKIWGLNFKALKLVNIFYWYLAILCLYLMLLKSCGRGWAMASTSLLVFSSFFFIYKQNVLSDVPFFFFVCSSLYLFERYQDGGTRRFFILFLLSMSTALWVRSAGTILFVAAGFYFLLVKRDLKWAGGILLTYFLNEILIFIWVGYQPGFFLTMEKFPQVYFLSMIYNIPIAFKSLVYFFCPPQNTASSMFFNIFNAVMNTAAPCLYAVMLWIFIRRILNKSLSLIYCFSFFYLTMAIIWSGFTIPTDWFTRYIFPLIPMVFIESYQLLQWNKGRYIIRTSCKVIFCLVLSLNIMNIVTSWNFNDDTINQLPNRQLMAWVKRTLKPNEHYIFWKARCMALLTGRVGTVFWLGMTQQPNFEERVANLNISYVILSSGPDSRFIAYLQHQPRQWQGVWENNSYVIFRNLRLSGA